MPLLEPRGEYLPLKSIGTVGDKNRMKTAIKSPITGGDEEVTTDARSKQKEPPFRLNETASRRRCACSSSGAQRRRCIWPSRL